MPSVRDGPASAIVAISASGRVFGVPASFAGAGRALSVAEALASGSGSPWGSVPRLLGGAEPAQPAASVTISIAPRGGVARFFIAMGIAGYGRSLSKGIAVEFI